MSPRVNEFRCGRLSVLMTRTGGHLILDVCADGIDLPVYQVRLDADRNTVAVLRSIDADPEVVYQGEPLSGALAATAPRDPFKAWEPRVGARCVYRGAWGALAPVAGVIVGAGEKNGRRVYDVQLDGASGLAWGYRDQFGPEGVR